MPLKKTLFALFLGGLIGIGGYLTLRHGLQKKLIKNENDLEIVSKVDLNGDGFDEIIKRSSGIGGSTSPNYEFIIIDGETGKEIGRWCGDSIWIGRKYNDIFVGGRGGINKLVFDEIEKRYILGEYYDPVIGQWVKYHKSKKDTTAKEKEEEVPSIISEGMEESYDLNDDGRNGKQEERKNEENLEDLEENRTRENSYRNRQETEKYNTNKEYHYWEEAEYGDLKIEIPKIEVDSVVTIHNTTRYLFAHVKITNNGKYPLNLDEIRKGKCLPYLVGVSRPITVNPTSRFQITGRYGLEELLKKRGLIDMVWVYDDKLYPDETLPLILIYPIPRDEFENLKITGIKFKVFAEEIQKDGNTYIHEGKTIIKGHQIR
ncbi:MAG: hypothetical protein NZ889_00575 [Candidatus Pacearchaeota archaeon]|nr:hypothetical protein [Candidatus Pacearchaeota archaeon]